MTVLAQLYLNESAELDFGLDIDGADGKTIDIRFIIEGQNYGIICKCIEADGVITVSIPKLSGILESGTYSSTLEVIVDGKCFQPLTENIKFENPISVGLSKSIQVKPKNTVSMEATDMGMRVKSDVQVRPAEIKTEKVKQPNTRVKNDKLVEVYNKIRQFEAEIKSIKNLQ